MKKTEEEGGEMPSKHAGLDSFILPEVLLCFLHGQRDDAQGTRMEDTAGGANIDLHSVCACVRASVCVSVC